MPQEQKLKKAANLPRDGGPTLLRRVEESGAGIALNSRSGCAAGSLRWGNEEKRISLLDPCHHPTAD